MQSHSKNSAGGVAVVVGLVLVLVAAPLLYIASVGPAVALANWGVIRSDENSLAAKVYSPLEFLHSSCEPIRRGLDWYVSLWDYAAPAPAPLALPATLPAAPSPAPTGS